MSRHLDARHRAMLQEMGVHVWSPQPAPDNSPHPTPPPQPDLAELPEHQHRAHCGAAALGPRPVPQGEGALAQHSQRTQDLAGARTPAPPPAAAAAAPLAIAPGAALAWVLQAAQPVYRDADPQAGAAVSVPCWLLVAEGVAGADPLAGDAGRLLDNMLRALRLQHRPQVFICTLAPLAPDAAPAAAPCAQALAQAIHDVQPAVVLLMGRAAARAALGRSEPLGQLRTQSHAVAGVPAVVTYDTPYLLRAPDAKAGAWDDLCRARTLALGPHSGAAPLTL